MLGIHGELNAWDTQQDLYQKKALTGGEGFRLFAADMFDRR